MRLGSVLTDDWGAVAGVSAYARSGALARADAGWGW